MSGALRVCLWGRLLDERRSATENTARLAWVRERAARYQAAGDGRREALTRAWQDLGSRVPGVSG